MSWHNVWIGDFHLIFVKSLSPNEVTQWQLESVVPRESKAIFTWFLYYELGIWSDLNAVLNCWLHCDLYRRICGYECRIKYAAGNRQHTSNIKGNRISFTVLCCWQTRVMWRPKLDQFLTEWWRTDNYCLLFKYQNDCFCSTQNSGSNQVTLLLPPVATVLVSPRTTDLNFTRLFFPTISSPLPHFY